MRSVQHTYLVASLSGGELAVARRLRCRVAMLAGVLDAEVSYRSAKTRLSEDIDKSKTDKMATNRPVHHQTSKHYPFLSL
jgi:hypothetical protein